METSRAIEMTFFGPVALRAAGGAPIAMRSKRAQAILGILAVSHNHAKDRRAIQEMLWPGRSVAQAQSSLRQEVSRIRKTCESPELLLSVGQQLKLNCDLAHFSLAREQAEMASAVARAEFMEGINFDGPFAEWIAEVRARFGGPKPKPQAQQQPQSEDQAQPEAPEAHVRPVVNEAGATLDLQIVRHTSRTVAGDVFLDRVSRSISDSAPVRILDRPDKLATPGVVLQHGSTTSEDKAILRHQLSSGGEKQVLWNSEWIGKTDALLDSDLLREGYLAHQAILGALGASGEMEDPVRAGIRGIIDAFSLERHRVEAAEVAFIRAYEASRHAGFLSWRSFTLCCKIVERYTPDPKGAAEEALSLAWQAVSLQPNNSDVLSVVSHVMRILDEDTHVAAEFAEDAVRINPSNPLGWASAANAMLMLGYPEKARPMADRALQIARNSHHRFWWEMNACVMAVMVGDSDAGKRHAATAHRLKPDFRPPLRYLVALHVADNEPKQALRAAQKLKVLEPDFEVRLFHEPEYPTGTLRATPTYRKIRELDLKQD